MIELIPHAFSMLTSLTHLLPLPPILALNTIHVPPNSVFVYGIKKQKNKNKKPQKNKILYGSVIQ